MMANDPEEIAVRDELLRLESDGARLYMTSLEFRMGVDILVGMTCRQLRAMLSDTRERVERHERMRGMLERGYPTPGDPT